MHSRILTPNELDLSFPTPNYCTKFHQILFKIATVGAMTDTHTHTHRHLIICPMLCYSNGTDKNGYNSAYIRAIPEIFVYNRGFSRAGY